MSMTVEQWLAQGDDLPVKLAEVFISEEEWKHDFVRVGNVRSVVYVCRKCDKNQWPKTSNCSVPDPIKIDLGTALERFRQMPKTKYTVKVMHKIYRLQTGVRATLGRTLLEWFLFNASAETLLIAAATVAERSKE